jgi:HSP20 family molecular chaperone IbpA
MLTKKRLIFIIPVVAAVSMYAQDVLGDPFGDEIFKEMYQMQKKMDSVFERMQERMSQRMQLMHQPTTQTFIPQGGMNVTKSMLEDKGEYYLYHTNVPQNPENQIDISIKDQILFFKATVHLSQKHNGVESHATSMIQRSERLPQDADPTSLKSEYQNGLLLLKIEKQKASPIKNDEHKQTNTTQS